MLHNSHVNAQNMGLIVPYRSEIVALKTIFIFENTDWVPFAVAFYTPPYIPSSPSSHFSPFSPPHPSHSLHHLHSLHPFHRPHLTHSRHPYHPFHPPFLLILLIFFFIFILLILLTLLTLFILLSSSFSSTLPPSHSLRPLHAPHSHLTSHISKEDLGRCCAVRTTDTKVLTLLIGSLLFPP